MKTYRTRAVAGKQVQGQQRQRHAVRHLQLEVAVVLEAVGIEPKEQTTDEGRNSRAGQVRRQQYNANADAMKLRTITTFMQ